MTRPTWETISRVLMNNLVPILFILAVAGFYFVCLIIAAASVVGQS